MMRPWLFAIPLALAACGGSAFTSPAADPPDAVSIARPDADPLTDSAMETATPTVDTSSPGLTDAQDSGRATDPPSDGSSDAPPEATGSSPDAGSDGTGVGFSDAGDVDVAAPPIDAGPLCCASSCSAAPLPCGVGSTNCATRSVGALCGAVNGSCIQPGRVVACP